MKTEKNEFSLVVRASVGESHTRERWSLSLTHTHTLQGMIEREPENSRN